MSLLFAVLDTTWQNVVLRYAGLASPWVVLAAVAVAACLFAQSGRRSR